MPSKLDCPLCTADGGTLIHRHAKFRVIEAQEALYPGFLRLVWNDHMREFSQLPREDRLLCVDAFTLLEEFALNTFKADKVNLATLGNVVPHLHWHIIPRYEGDAHFPAPVWAQAKPNAALTDQQKWVREKQAQWSHELSERLNKAFPS